MFATGRTRPGHGLKRKHQNVDEAPSFLVELGRLATVDEEHNRIVEIRAEAGLPRREHRQAGAAAVARVHGGGETPTGIADLTEVKDGEARAVWRRQAGRSAAARTRRGTRRGLGRGRGPACPAQRRSATVRMRRQQMVYLNVGRCGGVRRTPAVPA